VGKENPASESAILFEMLFMRFIHDGFIYETKKENRESQYETDTPHLA